MSMRGSDRGAKIPISSRRREQNKQAQKKYRERQKKQLQLLHDLVGHQNGISLPQPAQDSGSYLSPYASQQEKYVSPYSAKIAQEDFPVTSALTAITPSDPPVCLQSVAVSPYANEVDYRAGLLSLELSSSPDQLSKLPDCGRSCIQEFLQELDVPNGTLERRIHEHKLSVSDILKAGLKALSENSQLPDRPSVEQSGKEDFTAPIRLRNDKIIQLQIPTERTSDIRVNSIRLKNMMFAAACVANATALGFVVPHDDCEGYESRFFQLQMTEDAAMISCSRDFSHLKEHLRPVASQLINRHHPYLDVLPFPTFRDRVLKLTTCDPPMIDEDELCNDLENDGLICWGSSHGGSSKATGSGAPWDIRSWEAAPWFIKKWWIIIGGAEGEIYKQTEWWCALRGDRSCYPW